MKLASCKSALNPLVVYSTDRSKALVPVLGLLLCGLFYEAICFISYLFFVLVFFCVFLFFFFVCLFFSVLLAFRLPRFGKTELILVLFVCLFNVLVWFCQFPLPFGVWEGLRFVIVALPGLSYLFFFFFFVFIFYYSNMYWVIYRSDINTFLLWVSWILRDMHVLKHILNFIDDVAAATCPRGRWARGTPLYIHVVIEAGGGSHQLHFGGWGHIVHMRHTSLWRYSYWGTVRVLGWIE